MWFTPHSNMKGICVTDHQQVITEISNVHKIDIEITMVVLILRFYQNICHNGIVIPVRFDINLTRLYTATYAIIISLGIYSVKVTNVAGVCEPQVLEAWVEPLDSDGVSLMVEVPMDPHWQPTKEDPDSCLL